jgi:glycosyltransferase involved in cell wall biosynthesis
MLRPLTTPPRVLMTVDAVGGVWRYAIDLARSLDDAGGSCLLVGFGPGPSEAQHAEVEGIARAKLVWCDEPLDWMVEDEASLGRIGPLIERLAHDFSADLLHLNAPSQAVGIEGRPKVVVASHSCVATWWEAVRGEALPAAWRWQAERTRRGLLRADAVLAPSASHGAALQRVYALETAALVVANATAMPDGDIVKEPIIVSAGRWWDAGKNAGLLDAVAASCPWPVLMCGATRGPKGDEARIVHAHALGELTAGEMRRLLARTAIFASPSLYEPFGLAVLEAAAHGAALVLADIPTFRELWTGAAVFAEPDDPTAFRAALSELANNTGRRSDLAGAAQRRAAAFSLHRQRDELLGAYRIVLEGAEPSIPMVA